MSKEPIVGSGFKGPGFEMKGFQQRNLENLLKTLSNKETQKSIEALSKIKKDEWKAMATTAIMLNSFLTLGGIEAFTSRFTESIKNTIELKIDEFLSPLNNQINQAISDILAPFLANILTPVVNNLTTFLGDNMVGAGIGGIAGAIASMVLPGGPIWIAIGAAIGAAIQDPGFAGDDRFARFDAWLDAQNAPTQIPFIPGVPIGGGALPMPPRDPGRIGRLGEFEEAF